METPEGMGNTDCLNSPGCMTKVAVMPIYGKIPSKSYIQVSIDLPHWCVALGMSTKLVQNDDLDHP